MIFVTPSCKKYWINFNETLLYFAHAPECYSDVGHDLLYGHGHENNQYLNANTYELFHFWSKGNSRNCELEVDTTARKIRMTLNDESALFLRNLAIPYGWKYKKWSILTHLSQVGTYTDREWVNWFTCSITNIAY